MIRIELPYHLRTLAGIEAGVEVDIEGTVTQRAILDALEARHPELRGTTRDPATGRRRPFLRFFAAGLDLSHEEPDDPVPPEVAQGKEPFLVVGSVAGG